MTEKEDIKFMRRCLELATKANGMTYPNPMVGSVIVHEGKIVGEGYHIRSGEAHAEVNAINSVSDRSVLKRSTLYVNLEPCSHYGKTPPCADFIISNQIPRIVIGTTDTSEKISGKGIKMLQDSGCEVITGILDAECRRVNRRFFTFHEKRRPYITLKWAQSADGYLDINRSENHKTGPTWISGKPERVLVHKWRAAEQAILVGAGTIRADDPRLNVREWQGVDPLKLILSSSGSFSSRIAEDNTESKIIVFTHNPEALIPGSTIVILNKNKSSSLQICEYLYSKGIQSLFIEGGAGVLDHFILTGLWDEARIFTGRDLFIDGVKAPRVSGMLFSKTVFSGSSLEIYLKNGG
jgi:diaminohydroxyphosphoribosylaminopyrimidine deaminase / 5-amino-6-(5-phosphoribosylamino)uracil reductase